MSSIFIRTILIYLFLTFMLKIMGKRQIGELEVSELVSTLLISEIAAIPISDSSIPFIHAVVPIVFICSLEVAISGLKNKLGGLKRAIEGKPTYIIYKGKLSQGALLDNRISIDEVMTEMRTQGIGDISEISYGILEQTGKLSLMKKSDATPLAHALIVDGRINDEELRRMGYDKTWLDRLLSKTGRSSDKIFLLTVNDDGETNVILKEYKK